MSTMDTVKAALKAVEAKRKVRDTLAAKEETSIQKVRDSYAKRTENAVAKSKARFEDSYKKAQDELDAALAALDVAYAAIRGKAPVAEEASEQASA